MGFLTVLGYVMTYNEYKEHINCYKKAGLIQFKNLFNKHKSQKIEEKNLHWGEEIEYHIFSFREKDDMVLISCDAPAILEKYALEVLVMTKGAEGAVLLTADCQFEQPGVKAQVVEL